ncbi:unnamed protein product, partial [Rotaria sordida]
MHYARYEFSKNGLPTIEAIQPNVMIGQRLYLSPTDIREIQLYYNCTGSESTLPPTTTVITPTTMIPLSKCAKVTASNYTTAGYGSPMYQGNYLVDRQSTGLGFNSGGFAPQYIQLELPQDSRVRDICLQVNQYPSGTTNHQLFVGSDLNSMQLIRNLVGTTQAGQWINITFNPPLNKIRFLRVNTTSSPAL